MSSDTFFMLATSYLPHFCPPLCHITTISRACKLLSIAKNISLINILNCSFYRLYTNQLEDDCFGHCSILDRVIWACLIVVAFVVSLSIKLVVRKESQLLTSESSDKYGSLEIAGTVFAIITVLASGILAFLGSAIGDHMVIRAIFISHACITLPIVIFLLKPKIRSMALRKVINSSHKCIARVYPAYVDNV